MKIALNDLRNGIAIVNPAAAKRTTLPILTHIVLRTGGGELGLTCNNLEIAITTSVGVSVGAMVEEDFSITVPAKLFTDYIAALGDGEVEMSVDEETLTLTVKTAGNAGSIKGMSPEDFPASPVVEGEVVEFAPADLLEAIDMVAFAANADESRIVLTGVLVNLSGQKMTMLAADGFRLSKYERSIDDEADCQLLVPAKALRALAKISQYHPEDIIEMRTEESRLVFEVGPMSLTCVLLDGHYPEVEATMPDEDQITTTMTVSRKDFLGVVKTANVFTKHEKGMLILEIVAGLEGEPGIVSISGQSAEFGDNTGECDAEVEGNNLEIALNAKYLTEVLTVLKDEQVKFQFTITSAPVMIKQQGFTHIIMPMHVTQ